MAYKCLSLCGLFSFFKGFSENLFHAGFQFIQIEGRSLHGKTENLLLFRVGEIALIVLEHPLPCVLHHFSGCAQGFIDPHELVRDLISLELFRVGCGHRNRSVGVGFCVSSFHCFRDLRVHDLGEHVLSFVRTALHEFGHIEIIKGFMRMCNDGWLQGWHERNGGNLTYRMKEEEVAQCRPFFDEQPRAWVSMGVQADNLAGEYFITTGSGKFFRNVEPDPVHSIGIVEINDKGDSWRIVWGLEGGAKPTSEFPSHFMNHSVRKAATNGANRVIYHCHATNVIALTYILPLTDRDFTRALWQSATECPVVFPEGVGVCPWMVPGGADIAMATSELMKTYQAAIWAQHGLFASGPDFDSTFGLAHTIEKSAEIYVKVLSMGGGIIRQTITDDDLRAIARDFGVTLNEKFLN